MMPSPSEWMMTIEPVLPLPALAGIAIGLALVTIWTYQGVAGSTPRRMGVLLGLRLLALFLACFVLLRPAFGFRKNIYPPSVLIIATDASESMTIQDELRGQSRWQNLLRVLDDCEPIIRELNDQFNVRVVIRSFAEDIRDFDPHGQADGQHTDFGRLLQSLYAEWHQERSLCGLLILSDGANNGDPEPVLPTASRWRNLPCLIHTFGFGKPRTRDRQNDIAVVEHPAGTLSRS